MDHAVCSSSVSTIARLRITTCSYVLQRGSRCLGAAVRGRSYCRHHQRIRISLRRMARSRRRTPVPQVSLVDAAAIRQTEIQLRIALAARRIDPASGRMLFWVLRMAQYLDRTLDHSRQCGPPPSGEGTPIQPPKSDRINQVPLNHLNSSSYRNNDS
jgi:hypothetical protein